MRNNINEILRTSSDFDSLRDSLEIILVLYFIESRFGTLLLENKCNQRKFITVLNNRCKQTTEKMASMFMFYWSPDDSAILKIEGIKGYGLRNATNIIYDVNVASM